MDLSHHRVLGAAFAASPASPTPPPCIGAALRRSATASDRAASVFPPAVQAIFLEELTEHGMVLRAVVPSPGGRRRLPIGTFARHEAARGFERGGIVPQREIGFEPLPVLGILRQPGVEACLVEIPGFAGRDAGRPAGGRFFITCHKANLASRSFVWIGAPSESSRLGTI